MVLDHYPRAVFARGARENSHPKNEKYRSAEG
jgi:hypothetical protein